MVFCDPAPANDLQGLYARLDGGSGLLRNGSADILVNFFTTRTPFPGNDIVDTSAGLGASAAITQNGTLYLYNNGGLRTYLPATSHKKYVAASAFVGWVLTIYQDDSGVTHLKSLGWPKTPPPGIPTGTGWKAISAGANYGLAIHDDGTLETWGDNTKGQRNLPSAKRYKAISASDEFSLGLDENGTIWAAGNDNYGQVSKKPSGDGYINIVAAGAAGINSGFAFDPDGRIVHWGMELPDGIVPAGTGYTDISVWRETMFALKESAPERHTGPISPGLTLHDTGTTIPWGSSLDHTH